MVKTADIKLGYTCNSDCVHCVVANQKKRAMQVRGNTNRLTQEYVDEVLKSKKNGCEHIVLTGGEPTIRADFLEIIKFLNDECLDVTLQTNGRKFDNKEFAINTRKYINKFVVSLHGSTSEINDKITRAKNNFEQTVEGLKNLKELNSNICIKIVISKYNQSDLLNTLKLIYGIGIEYASLTFPHPHGNAKNYFDEVIPNYIDIKEEIENCINYSKEKNIKLTLESILPCALDNEFELKYFADLKIHNQNSELKQLDTPFVLDRNDAIEGSNSKKKGKACIGCIYFKVCDGYWKEYVDRRGFNEFKGIKKMPKELLKIYLKKVKSWK